MVPAIRTPLLLLIINLTLAMSAFANASDPTWRMPDGSYTAVPADANATATSAIVKPGIEGSLAFPAPFAIQASDIVSISLTIDIQTTEADAGAEGQAGVVLTLLPKASPNTHNAEHRQIAIVGSQTEDIQFAFRSRASYAAGEIILLPTLSYFGRALALTDIAFENHGADADPNALTASTASYIGQEPDAAWREKAAEKIDQHRKSDLRVVVTDRFGNPYPGVTVSVEQLRHAYPFGTAIVASRLVDAPRNFLPGSDMTTELWLSDSARYREEILRNFNTVVTENDLKWPQWAFNNRIPGRFHQDWTLDALEWLHQHEFTVKGHTLVWGSWRFTPTWLRDLEEDPEALHATVLAHIRDMGGATAERTQYWDVLNEPMSHRNLIELLGMEKVAEWFKAAREALPGNRLVMNEFDLVGNGGSPARRAGFLKFYKELVDHGAPLDVIGFQGHFWSERFTAPEQVWAIIDEVHDATGLPVMISEFDSNVPNEQLQADFTRDFLTAWFAHPATEAFIMWGFWGGTHWMGDTGSMYRQDWSEKPNLAAYRNLVYGDWWTQETVKTGADGSAVIRAFHGRHAITVKHPDGRSARRTVSLDADGRTLHIIIHQPEHAEAETDGS